MKKIFKISVALILCAVMVLSLASCGEIEETETTVTNMFVALKSLDFDEAQKYIDVDSITDSGNEQTDDAEMFINNLFDKLDYEIISSELIDKNTVNVNTKITVIDLKPVLKDYFSKAMEYAISNMFADPQSTDEEMDQAMEKIFVDLISNPELKTLTTEVTIKVVKEDGTWRVVSDEVLVNALLGDLKQAMEELNNSLGE